MHARVVAFHADQLISNFGTKPEVRVSGDTISLYSLAAKQSLTYSLSNDVRSVEFLGTVQKVDRRKTAGRMALTSIGWSMVRPRRHGNVALGSALLDYRYFGTEKHNLAHVQITFRDFTRVTIECDEPQLSEIKRAIPQDRKTSKATSETEKAFGAIKRMIDEGRTRLGEVRDRVSQIEAAIKQKSEIADNGATFEDRDAAREEIETLRGEIAIPKAALYALTTGLVIS